MLHSEGNASISLYTKVTASKNEARSPTIENDPTNNQHQPPADATMGFPSSIAWQPKQQSTLNFTIILAGVLPNERGNIKVSDRLFKKYS